MRFFDAARSSRNQNRDGEEEEESKDEGRERARQRKSEKSRGTRTHEGENRIRAPRGFNPATPFRCRGTGTGRSRLMRCDVDFPRG
jgi:hypothetical protein